TWSDALGIGSEGVVFTRNNNAGNLPNTTFNIADWTYVDWTACADNDYSNIGTYEFSNGTPPAVTSIVSNTTSCNEITISVSATEGTVGGNTLAYYWYAFDPSNAGLGWQAISNGGIYTTTTNSPNLIISDANSVSDFQFYCQVREDDATCYTASNATSIIISQATWNGTNWIWNDGTATNTLPTISTNIVLAANFSTANTGLQQSFSACNLTLNDNVTLTINNGHYVEIENNLDVNNTTSGGINIEPQGSFVQINDSGDVNADIGTNLRVSKLTAPSNNWYEYTYWSSPVFEETPAVGLAASNPNRRFHYNAQYYRDSTFENNNDDTTSEGAGIDDVDDQAPYDWGNISTTYLIPGVGYASTHDPIVFGSTPNCPGPACRIRYTFSGLFNNGIITVPLYRNDSETDDNNWNLIGNPYPSAIDADVFLNTNMGVIDQSIPEPNPIVEGAIYLWSQNTAPNNTSNGNENINFSQSDYAIINGTGQTAAQNNGGDSTIPTRHIPSGQAFFIVMDDAATSTQVLPSPVSGEDIQTANVIFNNAMRVTGNNNQFFRTSSPKDKLWINLTTDNGAFSQILVGYLENATNDYDGMYFDALKNGSVESNTSIYTRIDGIEKAFAIQGKSLTSLSMDEIIPLGFNTYISAPTIYTLSIAQVEGTFMNENEIFVVDKLLNTIHNLKASDYAFTSDPGTFEDRFDIVFRADALSIDDSIFDANALIITELSEKEVQIKVGANHTISNVEILDVLGRLIYSFNGNSSIEVYDISKLSKAAYIAKVTLSNGQTISKKAIKRL
ncbi:MAG: T9SS type A sorting domain-containing protein, partial [Winogradskyella sp.]|uniref:T9SS type A sorting domain-containing protein n=1 Tax=Winogradskyella sp. TaxID=1883156 RepID=UPI0025D6DC71